MSILKQTAPGFTSNQIDIFIIGGVVFLVFFIIIIFLLSKLSKEKVEHIEQDRIKHDHICWHGFLKKLQDHYRQKHEEEILRVRLKDCSSYSVLPKSEQATVQPKTVECDDYDVTTPLCRAISVESVKEFPDTKNRSRSLGAALKMFKNGKYSEYTFPPKNN